MYTARARINGAVALFLLGSISLFASQPLDLQMQQDSLPVHHMVQQNPPPAHQQVQQDPPPVNPLIQQDPPSKQRVALRGGAGNSLEALAFIAASRAALAIL